MIKKWIPFFIRKLNNKKNITITPENVTSEENIPLLMVSKSLGNYQDGGRF